CVVEPGLAWSHKCHAQVALSDRLCACRLPCHAAVWARPDPSLSCSGFRRTDGVAMALGTMVPESNEYRRIDQLPRRLPTSAGPFDRFADVFIRDMFFARNECDRLVCAAGDFVGRNCFS